MHNRSGRFFLARVVDAFVPNQAVRTFFFFFFLSYNANERHCMWVSKKKKGEENASCYCCYSLLFCFCHVCFILWTVWVTARKALVFRTPTYIYTIYNEHVHASVSNLIWFSPSIWRLCFFFQKSMLTMSFQPRFWKLLWRKPPPPFFFVPLVICNIRLPRWQVSMAIAQPQLV